MLSNPKLSDNKISETVTFQHLKTNSSKTVKLFENCFYAIDLKESRGLEAKEIHSYSLYFALNNHEFTLSLDSNKQTIDSLSDLIPVPFDSSERHSEYSNRAFIEKAYRLSI